MLATATVATGPKCVRCERAREISNKLHRSCASCEAGFSLRKGEWRREKKGELTWEMFLANYPSTFAGGKRGARWDKGNGGKPLETPATTAHPEAHGQKKLSRRALMELYVAGGSTFRDLERDYLAALCAQYGGDVDEAAVASGLAPATLRVRMRRFRSEEPEV